MVICEETSMVRNLIPTHGAFVLRLGHCWLQILLMLYVGNHEERHGDWGGWFFGWRHYSHDHVLMAPLPPTTTSLLAFGHFLTIIIVGSFWFSQRAEGDHLMEDLVTCAFPLYLSPRPCPADTLFKITFSAWAFA